MASEGNLFDSFVALTGAAAESAESWLEMANFDLETAVQLFFENGDKPPQVSAGPSLLNSIGNDKGGRTEKRHADEIDYVRAPDQVKRGRLFDTMPGEEFRPSLPVISAFKSAKSGADASSKTTLASMFQAPVDIMTAGTFDSVRDLALYENRWLLVNIQRESEFQSHVLNRDFWNDETAKNLIACNFIFWQQQDISFEGEKFISRYKVTTFPLVCIVDPRTGAVKWRKEGAKATPTSLGESLQDFIDRTPTPIDESDLFASSSTASGARPVDQFDSVFAFAKAPAVAEAVEDVVVDQPSSSSSAILKEKQPSPQRGFSVKEVLDTPAPVVVASESAVGKPFAIKIKLPSGKQIILQRSQHEPLLSLLQSIAQEMSPEQRFEVSFGMPVRNLSEQNGGDMTQSLQSGGIAQSMLLHVRPVE